MDVGFDGFGSDEKRDQIGLPKTHTGNTADSISNADSNADSDIDILDTADTRDLHEKGSKGSEFGQKNPLRDHDD